MAKRERYRPAQVIKALRSQRGRVYLAARELGCSPRTVLNYARRHESVRDTIDEERGNILDLAENRLYEAIDAGEPWAICFALKTIGKQRGYTERFAIDQQITEGMQAIYGKLAAIIMRHYQGSEKGEKVIAEIQAWADKETIL